jgi:hypothetical protein
MPGMALLIDGAVQQAAHWARHCIVVVVWCDEAERCWRDSIRAPAYNPGLLKK